MSNASKFRKKAVEYEQLKQFDRAVTSYVRAIEENESAREEVDVALFNKVGDLTLRQGRVTEAVTYYERAVDHYVNGGLFDNAIALCNKILRNAPGRSNVYFTLGRICGRKGLRSDATRNFLEYATRMQGEGRVEEGMRALAEVAELMPELVEVGRLVQEHAARAGIALPERRRLTPPAPVKAQQTNAAGQVFGLSKDLVFLDIEYDAPVSGSKTPGRTKPNRSTPVAPVAVRVPSQMDAAPGIAALPESKVAENESTAAGTDTMAGALAHVESALRLEDLLIFDPDGAFEQSSNAAASSSVAVDGTSILRPFVDPSTPLSALTDLEPTEDVATPGYAQEFKATPTIPELLERGVSRMRVEAAQHQNDRALHGSIDETHATSLSAVTPPHNAAPAAPLDAFVTAASAPVAPAGAVGQPAPTVEPVDSIATSNSALVPSSADAAIVSLTLKEPANASSPTLSVNAHGASASNNAPVVASSESVKQAIDGFASEDHLHQPSYRAPTEHVPEIHTIANGAGVGAIDLTAMLAASEKQVAPIDDLESEEFAPANDELAAHMFVRLDTPQAVDTAEAFDPADELPPLIFPMPFDAYPLQSTSSAPSSEHTDRSDALFHEPVDSTNLYDVPAYDLPAYDVPAYDVPAYDLPAFDVTSFDVPSVDAPSFDGATFDDSLLNVEAFDGATFDDSLLNVEAFDDASLIDSSFDDSTLDDSTFNDTAFDDLSFEPDAFRAPPADATAEHAIQIESSRNEFHVDATYEASSDTARNGSPGASTEDGYRIPDELQFIVATDEFDSTEVVAIADASDLNVLCIDGDIPTAVAAAEATVVASSRRNDLRDAVVAAPSDWTLRRRLAEALFEAGERDAAIAELTVALGGHAGDGALSDAAEIADELVRVAGDSVHHHQKRVELAIRLSDQNRLREAYLDLADNLVRKGDDLRAHAVYARVLEIDPWDDRARTALGDAAPPPPERIVTGSDDGHIDLAAWLRDDDEPQSTRLRMREPEMSGNEQQDFNSLLRAFKDGVARTMGEDDHDSHYDLGVAYKEMGLLDDAIGEFQMALRSRNNRLAAYEALGQCFIEQGSYKVAVTVLSRALHEPAIRDEQRVGVLYLLGYSCEELHRFDEARSYFQRVYATDIHFRDVAKRMADLDRLTR